MAENDPMKASNKSGEKAVRRSVNVAGTFRILRPARRWWSSRPDNNEVDAPEALWLRLKPYPRLSKHRSDDSK
jgi:hypothetical protein